MTRLIQEAKKFMNRPSETSVRRSLIFAVMGILATGAGGSGAQAALLSRQDLVMFGAGREGFGKALSLHEVLPNDSAFTPQGLFEKPSEVTLATDRVQDLQQEKQHSEPHPDNGYVAKDTWSTWSDSFQTTSQGREHQLPGFAAHTNQGLQSLVEGSTAGLFSTSTALVSAAEAPTLESEPDIASEIDRFLGSDRDRFTSLDWSDGSNGREYVWVSGNLGLGTQVNDPDDQWVDYQELSRPLRSASIGASPQEASTVSFDVLRTAAPANSNLDGEVGLTYEEAIVWFLFFTVGISSLGLWSRYARR